MYNTIITNTYGIDNRRKKVRNFLVLILIFIGISLYVFFSIENNEILYIILFLLFFIFLLVKFVINKNEYSNMYKENVIKSIIGLVNKNLTYVASEYDVINGQEIRNNYIDINFDIRDFDNFSYKNYIDGNLFSNTYVKLADISVTIDSVSPRLSNTECFRGVFAYNNLNKTFNSSLLITKNISEIITRENRIKIENKEFEEYFDVYSEDKEFVEKIITDEFLNLLIDIYKRTNIEFEIGLKNNMIYFRFYTKNFLEAPIFKKAINKEVVFRYYCTLKYIIEIIEKVNLYIERKVNINLCLIKSEIYCFNKIQKSVTMQVFE